MLRREDLSAIYSWAVVTSSALSWTAEAIGDRKLLEIGAGSGCWSHQLIQRPCALTLTGVSCWCGLPTMTRPCALSSMSWSGTGMRRPFVLLPSIGWATTTG